MFKQNQLIVNSSIRIGAKLSLFGYYTLNYANSDTGAGAGSFPSTSTMTSASITDGRLSTSGTAYFLAEPSGCRMLFV